MKDFEQPKNWYSEVADTYTLEQRNNWYSEVANAYHKTRPRYPQELICRAVELAQLQKDASILEVGCGPGIATIAFAKFGFSMICVEPSHAACKIAKANCINYPEVEIKNTTFEDWELKSEKFDAVLAATSFHWVSPEIGYRKAAAALKDSGYLMLLWNKEPQPRYEVYQTLKQVYQAHAPSLARYEDRETQEKILQELGQNMINSGLFKDLVYEQLACEVTYSIDDYLTLLSTLSPYIRLEPQKRNSLFASLREVLEKNCGRSIQTSYFSAFHIGRKI